MLDCLISGFAGCVVLVWVFVVFGYLVDCCFSLVVRCGCLLCCLLFAGGFACLIVLIDSVC